MICPNCKKELKSGEGHFVPPSLGESGFFVCEKSKRLVLVEKGEESPLSLFGPQTGIDAALANEKKLAAATKPIDPSIGTTGFDNRAATLKKLVSVVKDHETAIDEDRGRIQALEGRLDSLPFPFRDVS